MRTIFALLAAIAVIVGVLLLWPGRSVAPEPGPGQGSSEPARAMSVEQYVRENIATLSPEPAVLGGTFYVTEISAQDGAGVVHYEDGHIALVADFTYTVDPEHGAITITSFVVRQ